MNQPPSGQSFKAPTKDQAQGLRKFSNDKIKSLSKLKVQQYVESFFNKAGANFDLLKIVSPRSITYNTDKSFDQATDPTQRKLQIARFFAELRNIVPAILIIDGEMKPTGNNLGLISDSEVLGNQWIGRFPIVREIPLTIVGAARDTEEADEISSTLSMLFNELRNLAGGNEISGNPANGEYWVIYLPNEPVTVSALNEIDVPDDPVEKVYYFELSVNVTYQDSIFVQQDMLKPGDVDSVVNVPDLNALFIPQILFPDTIPLNFSQRAVIGNFQQPYQVIIEDPRIATITTDYYITPRSKGTTKISVLDTRKKRSEAVIASKLFTVV